MAVRIVDAAVILQRRRLDRRWLGGSLGLIEELKDEWPFEIDFDDDLVAIGVDDIRGNDDFLEGFAEFGLVERFCRTWRHAAIVDQEWGPTYDCDWLDVVPTEEESWAWMVPRRV